MNSLFTQCPLSQYWQGGLLPILGGLHTTLVLEMAINLSLAESLMAGGYHK